MKRNWMIAALVPVLVAGHAVAADNTKASAPSASAQSRSGAEHDARQQVGKAARVIAKMKQDSALKDRMAHAKGILVMPDYGRGALGVGVQGGNGVLLVKNAGHWSGPALYNIGGVSLGVQAGGSGGSYAMLLMTDRAVKQFDQKNDFALDAGAGITVLPWTAEARARTGGDVIAWSGQKGLYAGASIGVTDVRFDPHETAALYGHDVAPADVFTGNVAPPVMASDLMREVQVG